MSPTAVHPGIDQISAWLSEVHDPEIPVLSIQDLGILRGIELSPQDRGLCIVTITPTYSACPAIGVIAETIRSTLWHNGIERVEIRTQLSPAWTTDWMTEAGRTRLREYGIAPPAHAAASQPTPSPQLIHIALAAAPHPACPLCGSTHTELISQFGSTSCKSLHRCLACREPFDHFKAH